MMAAHPTVLLIVDDNPEDRETYCRAITQDQAHEYIVSVAGTGEEGVDQFRTHRPDCVLLDYNLPDIDGLEVLARLGREAGVPCLPVIMLTGVGNEMVAVEALKRGAVDYLVKGSLTPETLRLAIGGAIEKVALYRRVRELDRAKTDFLSTASHELRTPLTIIREFVALVRDGIPGPVLKEQTECLDAALSNCDRLGALINNILDLQRIESGTQRLNRRATDLVTLVKNCERDFLPQCRKRNQRLTVEIPGPLPPVLCDESATAQILVNLVGNAHKFTPLQGWISIRATVDPKDADRVVVSVADTGPGISREDQGRIFDKFTQVDRKNGPGAKGNGLGLSIVRRLVQMQGGTITLESRPGAGSTFSFTVPVHSESRELAAFIEDARACASAAGHNLHVLLAKITGPLVEPTNGGSVDVTDCLKSADHCVGRVLHRHDDATLIVPSERTLVIASEVDKYRARILRPRLEESLTNEYGPRCPVEVSGGIIGAEEDVAEWLSQTQSQFAAPSAAPRPKRILIVDDEQMILDLISQALESSELNVKMAHAKDGYEACMGFGRFEPDLVILDVYLPRRDGEVVLRQIKSDRRGKQTKVILISGAPENFARLKNLGADACLTKPFDMQQLLQTVTHLLGADQTPVGAVEIPAVVNA